MRLASYNVENLFVRARALNLDGWSEGKKVLEDYVAVSELIEEPVYTDDIKSRIISHMQALGIDKRNDSKFVLLRENRGQLAKYSRFAGTKIVAGGREDWSGWIELRSELVDEQATRNTAKVVRDIDADAVALVEVEDRRAIRQFNDRLLATVGNVTYDQTMLIDGNDERGIDVGLMVRQPYRIGWMRGHGDDLDDRGRRVFSRDCPEYAIWTPAGSVVWVLINHFKARGLALRTAPTGGARRNRPVFARSTIGCVLKARTLSPSSATSTTRPTATLLPR